MIIILIMIIITYIALFFVFSFIIVLKDLRQQ